MLICRNAISLNKNIIMTPFCALFAWNIIKFLCRSIVCAGVFICDTYLAASASALIPITVNAAVIDPLVYFIYFIVTYSMENLLRVNYRTVL